MFPCFFVIFSTVFSGVLLVVWVLLVTFSLGMVLAPTSRICIMLMFSLCSFVFVMVFSDVVRVFGLLCGCLNAGMLMRLRQ